MDGRNSGKRSRIVNLTAYFTFSYLACQALTWVDSQQAAAGYSLLSMSRIFQGIAGWTTPAYFTWFVSISIVIVSHAVYADSLVNRKRAQRVVVSTTLIVCVVESLTRAYSLPQTLRYYPVLLGAVALADQIGTSHSTYNRVAQRPSRTSIFIVALASAFAGTYASFAPTTTGEWIPLWLASISIYCTKAARLLNASHRRRWTLFSVILVGALSLFMVWFSWLEFATNAATPAQPAA